MTSTSRDQIVFCAVLALLAVAGVWRAELWLYDEPREAELARAVLQSGEYGVPTLGGRLFLEKPPLFTWSVACAWRLLGRPSLLVGRLVAAAYASLALIALAWLVRRSLGSAAALVAAGALATCWRFHATSHTLILDNALLGCTTLAIVLGHVVMRERRPWLAALFGLALALAFLSKGLVGVAGAGLTLATDRLLALDARIRRLLVPQALLACLLPAALWGLVMYRKLGAPFLEEFVVNNHWRRLTSAFRVNPTPWWYYLQGLAGGLLPWTPLVPFALVLAHRLVRRRERERAPGERALAGLALAWSLSPLLLLQIAQTRSRTYLLPLMPGFALMIALLWQRQIAPRWLAPHARLAKLAVVALGAGAVGACLVLALLDHDALALAAFLLALAALGVLLCARHQPARASLAAIALVAAVLIAGRGDWFSARASAQLSIDPIVRAAWQQAGTRQLVLWRPHNSWSGAFAFAADREVPEIFAADELLARLTGGAAVVALAEEGTLEELPAQARARLALEWRASANRRTFVLVHAR
ncbi:MAG: glycosyltransferase family 39 protein [Planctomycetota bacterium]